MLKLCINFFLNEAYVSRFELWTVMILWVLWTSLICYWYVTCHGCMDFMAVVGARTQDRRWQIQRPLPLELKGCFWAIRVLGFLILSVDQPLEEWLAYRHWNRAAIPSSLALLHSHYSCYYKKWRILLLSQERQCVPMTELYFVPSRLFALQYYPRGPEVFFRHVSFLFLFQKGSRWIFFKQTPRESCMILLLSFTPFKTRNRSEFLLLYQRV